MPIKKLYVSNFTDMVLILTTIAFAVLFVSLLNYILLTLSALAKRTKSAAIHKTCGANAGNLQVLIFTETFILFMISLVSAFIVILLLKPYAEMQVGHKLSSMLNPVVIFPLIGLMIVLVVITSYLPGRFFSKIPIATAFRSYRQKKNKWQLALLSFQFIGASFILAMMVVVSFQYNKMLKSDHGYTSSGVYYASSVGVEAEKIPSIINELQTISGVEKVGLGSCLPIEEISGNNVLSPDGEKELFNVADFSFVDENYLPVLGIPIREGENFSKTNSTLGNLLISEKGAEKLKTFNQWKNVIGQQIAVTSYGKVPITGTFPDFIINTISHPDLRPSVFLYMPDDQFGAFRAKYPSFSFYFMIKVNKNADTGMLTKISDVINRFLPHQDANVKSLEAEQMNKYQAEEGFRNAMMTGNVVILLITIIGLLGYTSNEAERRRKELAIKKINGATFFDIAKMFIFDLEILAIPTVVIGLVIAWMTAGKWMQNFAVKMSLNGFIFIGCGLFIILMVAFVSIVNYLRTANQNPVESLRYE